MSSGGANNGGSLSYAPHVAQGINLARGVGVCGASLIMGVMNQWLTKCSCRGFHYLSS